MVVGSSQLCLWFMWGWDMWCLTEKLPHLMIDTNKDCAQYLGPNLMRLIAKGYSQIVLDVSVDVSDVFEKLLQG